MFDFDLRLVINMASTDPEPRLEWTMIRADGIPLRIAPSNL